MSGEKNLGHLSIGVGEVKHPHELSREKDIEEGYSSTSKDNSQDQEK